MRSRITQKTEFKKHQKETVEQVQLAFVGTVWCIVRDRLLLTAHHTLNNRAPRNPNDKFHIFAVPNNDEVVYHFPVSQFHLEDATSDLAIFEIPANDNPPVTSRVCGFPLQLCPTAPVSPRRASRLP